MEVSASGGFKFVTELFFLTQRALHVGLLPAVNQFTQTSSQLAKQLLATNMSSPNLKQLNSVSSPHTLHTHTHTPHTPHTLTTTPHSSHPHPLHTHSPLPHSPHTHTVAHVGWDLLLAGPFAGTVLLRVLHHPGSVAHQAARGALHRGSTEKHILHSTRACSQGHGSVVPVHCSQ